jgi:hypothetical protein
MDRTALSIILVLAMASLAGCVDSTSSGEDDSGQVSGPDPPRDPRVPASAADARVVVAVIDTGINVYHDAFQRAGGLPDDVVASFQNTMDDAAPQRVPLGHQGSFDERLDADADTWDTLEPRTLYYFEGTNVLGISFAQNQDYVVLDDPSDGHGSGTSGAVLAANPNAIVVLVEGLTSDGEAWAAQQPWIDVVSMSYGPIGSIPGSGSLFGLTTHQATRAMWDAGKVPVGAADNTPSLAPNDETAGPPWVVGVGGDHEETKCRDHVSGTFPDVTSDFTQTLPRHDSTDENRTMSGTSFATPKTAGIYSSILLEVRKAWNHTGGITAEGAMAASADGRSLTNADLRGAVNRTATYFDFMDCEAGGTQLPVNPAAPWLQMGWGHVGIDLVDPAVADLLGSSAAPEKDAGAVAFMEALHAYRELLWENQ